MNNVSRLIEARKLLLKVLEERGSFVDEYRNDSDTGTNLRSDGTLGWIIYSNISGKIDGKYMNAMFTYSGNDCIIAIHECVNEDSMDILKDILKDYKDLIVIK